MDNGASFTNDDKAAVLSLCSEPPPVVHSWVTLMVVVGFAIMFMISAAIVINSVSNIVGVPSVQVFEGGALFMISVMSLVTAACFIGLTVGAARILNIPIVYELRLFPARYSFLGIAVIGVAVSGVLADEAVFLNRVVPVKDYGRRYGYAPKGVSRVHWRRNFYVTLGDCHTAGHCRGSAISRFSAAWL